MLEALFVKNYRNLKDFKIKTLSRINLITGKNNTGKSTLLEAIAIYATKGDWAFIYELLSERGENFKRLRENDIFNITEANIKTLSSLFFNRRMGFEKEDVIEIGKIDDTLFGQENSNRNCVSLRLVKFHDEIEKGIDETVVRKRILIDEKIKGKYENYKIGFEVAYGNTGRLLPLDEERPYRFNLRRANEMDNLQYIRTRNIDRDVNGKLWDNIALTEKEQFVIDALKIIEPSTERIAFIDDVSNQRSAVIKLVNSNSVIPLRSMGDGINRILTIILALVNSGGGYLLIDEFENGLHYTVQEKLWVIVFSLAEKLNVQVFVTTHSEDCIIGFEKSLNLEKGAQRGKLIRLENNDGFIKHVEFNASELRTATDRDIETR